MRWWVIPRNYNVHTYVVNMKSTPSQKRKPILFFPTCLVNRKKTPTPQQRGIAQEDMEFFAGEDWWPVVGATPTSLKEVEGGTRDIGKERVYPRGVSSSIEIVGDGSGG
ncbi:hypothetical protein Droror1_Dr00025759 [Drosera rotundifolia]